MTERANFPLLPYTYVVGQRTLCRLLEVAYVMGPSSFSGVLVSGERGTAKSTIVRSFANMMYEKLPVTLPMNATDDRVIGGWKIDALMQGRTTWQDGLLEQANKRMLYIDEVNLLDDHIINLILDVASTSVLVVEREGKDDPQADVSFMLVGTMNPDEGALRPQLLDRFGLFVSVAAERKPEVRKDILLKILRFDNEREMERSDWLHEGKDLDGARRAAIVRAREMVSGVELDDRTVDVCARVAAEFDVVGHRAEIVMAQAASAVAAIDGRWTTTPEDLREIAPHAVMHRRRSAAHADGFEWTPKDDEQLARLIAEA